MSATVQRLRPLRFNAALFVCSTVCELFGLWSIDQMVELSAIKCVVEIGQMIDTQKTSRRDLLKGLMGAAAGLALPDSSHAFTGINAAKSAAELNPGTFRLLPLGEVRPTGWLRRQLRIQADGMGGHLDEFWPDVGSNSGWLGGTGESWERGPYFLDGLLPLAWQLDDDALKAKAQRFVDWTLNHQDASGMIGPASNSDWWPRMVMVKALMQYYEVTRDPRVMPALTRYFHYQLAALPSRPLKDWGKYRWQDEAFVVVWLYDKTGDPKLIELCRLLKQQGFDWEALFANFQLTSPMSREVLGMHNHHVDKPDLAMQAHGVNHSQALKVAAVQYRMSGDRSESANFDRQLAALDKYHGMPNGMFSCDEHLGGIDPSHGTELCSVVETMFSLEVVLATFGKAEIGDRIEKLAFNALPGTFTDDMWAHQYDQQSNQVQCSLNSKPWTTNSSESNLYGLEPNFGCCTANFHQGWPKFTSSLWMADGDDSLVAALYAPCEVTTKLQSTKIQLIEETDYPFRDTIAITVHPDQPIEFGVSLRIPVWADQASVQVNGQTVSVALKPGTFAEIRRSWKSGDRIVLKLPMQLRVSRWFQNSIAIERGSLLFSLDPGESWVKLRDRGMTADWQVFPTSSWNYALAVDEASAAGLHVVEASVPARPFTAVDPAVRIEVKGRRLNQWRSEDGVANPLPVSPVQSVEQEEMLVLVPYAGAKLRVTAFPGLGV
jgi:DUF1680 family protein